MQRKLNTSSAGEVRWEDAFLTWRFSPIKVNRLSANKKLMGILNFPENLLSVYHLLNKDWLFINSEHQRHKIISKKDIQSRWYSPDLLISLICAMRLCLYCFQQLWPSHCDSCYFGFRNSCFDSEVIITADSTDCWISTTMLPFLPTWRWSFLRVLMSGKARRQALSLQQSSPDGKMLYSSLLKCWKPC